MMMGEATAVIGTNARGMPTVKNPHGFNYPKYHEIKNPAQRNSGKHQYLMPTYRKWKKVIGKLVGKEVKAAFTQ